LTIQNLRYPQSADRGIEFAPSTSSSLAVSNTLVADNGGRGIIILPGGAGIFKAVFERGRGAQQWYCRHNDEQQRCKVNVYCLP